MTWSFDITHDLLVAREAEPAAQTQVFSIEDLPAQYQEPVLGVHVLGVYLVLATDANAANRRVRLRWLGAGSVPYMVWVAPSVQVAATTVEHQFAVAEAGAAGLLDLVSRASLPQGLVLRDPHSLEASVLNVQAGDDLTEMVIVGRLLPVPGVSLG